MRLAKLRTLAGLTQEELGRLSAPPGSNAKLQQARISGYELGNKGVSISKAMRIIEVLNAALEKKGLRTRARIEDFLPAAKKRA